MVLSKRERYIGMGAIGAVLFLGISSLIIGPYNDKADSIRKELAVARNTLADNANLFRAQKNRLPEWNAMLNNGLQSDDSTARSRTQQMLQAWARTANINLDSITPEPAPSQKGPFESVNFALDFNTSGGDSMRQIARFLWSVESAAIPIRLSSIRIQSQKEGTDQLNVKLIVSALYMPSANSNSVPGADFLNEFEGAQ